MTLRVTVVDEQTGDTSTATIPEGDYLPICHEPCYLDSTQAYPLNGVHVLTVKGHAPRRQTADTPKEPT